MKLLSRLSEFFSAMFKALKAVRPAPISAEFDNQTAKMRRDSQFNSTVMLNNARSNMYSGRQTQSTSSHHRRR